MLVLGLGYPGGRMIPGVDLPTLDEIRSRSPLLTAQFPDPSGDAALGVIIADASAVVSSLTGRAIGYSGEGLFGCTLEEVPPVMQPIALLVIARKAESFPLNFDEASRTETIEQAAGGLASFSAGPYSESYFGPAQAATAHALDADPEVNALLLALWTECARYGWARVWDPNAPPQPAAAIQTFDWFPGLRGSELGGWFAGGPGDPWPYGTSGVDGF